jgi:2'-5' RNA ligase
MRTFIAIDIPENDDIREIYQYLPLHIKGAKIKYTLPEQNHLTLAFLGEIDKIIADKLIQELSAIRLGESDITLELTGLGVFHSNRQPSVLWIGITPNEKLSKIYDYINRCIQNAGIAIDTTKSFSPHITVGRIKSAERDNNVMDVAAKFKSTSFGVLKITNFKLYKSTLTPKGPIYEVLETFPLQ